VSVHQPAARGAAQASARPWSCPAAQHTALLGQR
jgi:hypothetical protein